MASSALTSYHTGNSVASRLKQCSLKAKQAQESPYVSAFSPIDFRTSDDDKPKKKLSEGNRAIIRVIAQYLQDLGLHETVQTLSREARCKVENSHAARLRNAIHEGNWDDGVAIIDSCYDHLSEATIEKVRDIIREEKFFDLIKKQKRPLALHFLKTEFDPKYPRRPILVKHLFETDEEIFSSKNGRKLSSDPRSNYERICLKLQKELPSSFMLPANRLRTLLEQAFEAQFARCETHIHRNYEGDELAEPSMLYEDHKCTKRGEKYFVETCYRDDHKSEVWKVGFSPCGKYLASASFATVVYFWKVNQHTRQLDFYRKISARDTTHGISGMSWSVDSKLLAVCGVDDHPYGLYVYDMHGDNIFAQIPHLEQHSFTCIDFFQRPLSDGKYHLTIGDMRGSLQFLEIKRDTVARVIEVYEGYRIRCVYSCRSGRGAYAADTHNRVRWYRNTWKDTSRKSDHTVIREENTITNMCMHPSEQLLLLTTKNLGLRMWNVQCRTLMRTFQGYHDGGLVINAAFGGVNNEFIVTGSYATDEYDEEGNVIRKSSQQDYSTEETIRIWRLTDEYTVCGIAGHRSTVNCVSWNPKDPFMIASGSDDHSIRLWSCRQDDMPSSLRQEKEYVFGRRGSLKKDEYPSLSSLPVLVREVGTSEGDADAEDDDDDGSTDSDSDSDDTEDSDEDSREELSDSERSERSSYDDYPPPEEEEEEEDEEGYVLDRMGDAYRDIHRRYREMFGRGVDDPEEGGDEGEEGEEDEDEEDPYYEGDPDYEDEERDEAAEGEGEFDVEDEDADDLQERREANADVDRGADSSSPARVPSPQP